MRFLDLLTEWGGYSNRAHSGSGSGSGQPSDFTNRYMNWIGYNLQYQGTDPILREYIAAWIAKTFELSDPEKFITKVRTKKFEKNSAKPKFQQRHLWFIADRLKEISNQYMWRYAYDFFRKTVEGPGFKSELFAKAARPKVFTDDDR